VTKKQLQEWSDKYRERILALARDIANPALVVDTALEFAADQISSATVAPAAAAATAATSDRHRRTHTSSREAPSVSGSASSSSSSSSSAGASSSSARRGIQLQPDPYFPSFRHLDLFEGHSWASGLFASPNGRNQESSSEALASWDGLRLLGVALASPEIETLGELAGALELHSIKFYWHSTARRAVYPEIFRSWQMRRHGLVR
jgi:hypothetical protein